MCVVGGVDMYLFSVYVEVCVVGDVEVCSAGRSYSPQR